MSFLNCHFKKLKPLKQFVSLWTYEPPGTDARVFVSIFGHYNWTFDDPFFRLMLLRGMAWAAKDNPYRLNQLAVEGLRQ